MATKLLVDQMVTKMAEIYGQRLISEELLEIWNEALGNWSDDLLVKAYTSMVENRTQTTLPVPGDLKAALIKEIEDEAKSSWLSAAQAIRSNPGRPLEFEDTLTAEALRQMGGLVYLGGLSEKEFLYRKGEFVETYIQIYKRGKTYSSFLHGRYDCKPTKVLKNEISHNLLLIR